ncbi:AraC family transcriptional regulator [Phyllobacterium sp. 2063]|nr:AraC family transcriptional regulator [Phyllobacterium sp. 2063]
MTWRLCFQQPSAFSHACRRWTGKSPKAYRKQKREHITPLL